MAIIPVVWSKLLQEFEDMIDTDPWSACSVWGHPYLFHRRKFCKCPRKTPKSMDSKWTYNVEIGDFDPEHVKVKVEDGKVLIHAKYSDGNEEWGDTVEKKRMVKIPEDVNTEKIHSFMRSDGTLVLEGPYIENTDQEGPELTVKNEADTEMEKTLVPSGSQRDLMKVDVNDFKPEEVTVTCKDGVLTAKGKRQRSEDGIEIREEFFRQMSLPKSVNQKNLNCFKNAEGKLIISGPEEETGDKK